MNKSIKKKNGLFLSVWSIFIGIIMRVNSKEMLWPDNLAGGFMKKIMSKFLVLVIASSFLLSCSNQESDVVEIIPDDLFKNELKKIEPHLDLLTGYVDINYRGNKNKMSILYEVLKEGEVIKSQELMSKKFEGEFLNDSISLSVKKIDTNKYRLKLIDSGAGVNSIIDLPSDCFYNPINLEKKSRYKDSEKIIFWGISGAKKGSTFSYYNNNIYKTLKAGDYALVLKLKFE